MSKMSDISYQLEKKKLVERAEQNEVKWLKNQNHKVNLLQEMLDESFLQVTQRKLKRSSKQ